MARDYRVVPGELTVRATVSNLISYQLLSGTVGIDLSAVGTVELWLKDNAGGTSSYSTAGGSPKISIVGTASGSVGFTPGTGDLAAGSAPYQGYFRLRTGAAAWYHVPEDSELTIHVRDVY